MAASAAGFRLIGERENPRAKRPLKIAALASATCGSRESNAKISQSRGLEGWPINSTMEVSMNCYRMRVRNVLLLALVLLAIFPPYHQDGLAAPGYGAWSAPAN